MGGFQNIDLLHSIIRFLSNMKFQMFDIYLEKEEWKATTAKA
jgi:hypothetical protein